MRTLKPQDNFKTWFDKFNAIIGEGLLGYFSNDEDMNNGLDFYVRAGTLRKLNSTVDIPATFILLEDNATNLVYVNTSDGGEQILACLDGALPSYNAILLYEVETLNGQITSITDKRSWTDVALSAELAKKWAEGSGEIEPGSFSAKHWAEEAMNAKQSVIETVGTLTQDITGFPTRDTTSFSWSDATRTFTLIPETGAVVYYRGKEITLNTPLSIQISNIDGSHYIVLNPDTMELNDAGPHPDIRSQLLVAVVFWSVADAKAIIVGDERHSSSRDTQWHYSHHREIGTLTRSGGGITYTAEDPSALSIGITTPLIIADEDLEHTINHSATPANDFEQILSTASLPTLFFEGSAYRAQAASTTPWIQGTARVAYNPITAGVGALADAPNQSYINYWIVATNDIRAPVKAVAGRLSYSSVDDAQGEEFVSYGLPFPEIVPLHQVVLYVDDTLAGTLHAQIARVFVPKKISSGGSQVVSAESHDALSGRTLPDQHPASSITNVPTGNISATDVQSAINELDNEKVKRSGDTMTGKLTLPASTTSRASVNLPHGSNPTSPENGDIWTTTTSVLARINGSNRTLYHNGNLATISQAEAEAGTDTTVRAWTSQRVRQAIVAGYNALTSAFGRTLANASDAVAARNTLELGTAATRDVGSDEGNVLSVTNHAHYGLGPIDVQIPAADGSQSLLLCEWANPDHVLFGDLIGRRSKGVSTGQRHHVITISTTLGSNPSNDRTVACIRRGGGTASPGTLAKVTYNGTDYLALHVTTSTNAWSQGNRFVGRGVGTFQVVANADLTNITPIESTQDANTALWFNNSLVWHSGNLPALMSAINLNEKADLIGGKIPIEQIPHSAMERLVVVANKAARFALTKATVQNGDTVKQNDTGVMYYVVDDNKLGSEDGYEIYKAGEAASVQYSGIQNKPAAIDAIGGLTPAANKLPYYTGAGSASLTDITAAGRALLGGANAAAQRTTLGLGTAATRDVGSGANNVVIGSDPRLSDAREWIESTVSQTEAEAGTSTTRRAWTAQRVRQAIAAGYGALTSAFGRTLANASDATAARNTLGLGTAATRNVGSNEGDVPSVTNHDHFGLGPIDINIPTVRDDGTQSLLLCEWANPDHMLFGDIIGRRNKGLGTGYRHHVITISTVLGTDASYGRTVACIRRGGGTASPGTLAKVTYNGTDYLAIHITDNNSAWSSSNSNRFVGRGVGIFQVVDNADLTNITPIESTQDADTALWFNNSPVWHSGNLPALMSAINLNEKADLVDGLIPIAQIPVGSGANNVVIGSDPRLSDAREWTASTVSQTEAEAGTSTTRRAWTAQRVRQAITAWWAGVFGTGADQVRSNAQNDARFRLQSANVPWEEVSGKPSTVSQAEAEAGTSTTVRQWTAQRVRQAIVAAYNALTSAFGRTLANASNAAAARNALELGTAATRDVTTSRTDTTVGRVLKVGDFGVGAPALLPSGTDLDTITINGWYDVQNAVNRPEGTVPWGYLKVIRHSNSTEYCYQEWTELNGGDRTYYRIKREGNWLPWREFYHSGNLSALVSALAPYGTGPDTRIWQNVTSQRTINVNYTNTTLWPITVSIMSDELSLGDSTDLLLFVDGVLVARSANNNNDDGVTTAWVYADVPPGSTYAVYVNGTISGIDRWFERRM